MRRAARTRTSRANAHTGLCSVDVRSLGGKLAERAKLKAGLECTRAGRPAVGPHRRMTQVQQMGDQEPHGGSTAAGKHA